VSYRDVGIQLQKIFIINPQGEIHHFEASWYRKSYEQLSNLVDQMYPSVHESK
jgi:phosphatidate phosphatase PAH1